MPILLIDDSPDGRTVLREALTPETCLACWARGGGWEPVKVVGGD